jgi:hypothetical protein
MQGAMQIMPPLDMANWKITLADKKPGPTEEELLTLLLKREILSGAQAEVAKMDSASSGLSYADVLLARKWITEEDLKEFYPSVGQTNLGKTANEPASEYDKVEKSEATYLDNLQKYKQLMTKIMGGSY